MKEELAHQGSKTPGHNGIVREIFIGIPCAVFLEFQDFSYRLVHSPHRILLSAIFFLSFTRKCQEESGWKGVPGPQGPIGSCCPSTIESEGSFQAHFPLPISGPLRLGPTEDWKEV